MPIEVPHTAGISIRVGDVVGDQGLAGRAGPQFACHAVHVRLDRGPAWFGSSMSRLPTTPEPSSIPLRRTAGRGWDHDGVGQALTEGTQYGDDAKQRNTGLLEYKLQIAADASTIRTEFTEIPIRTQDRTGPRVWPRP